MKANLKSMVRWIITVSFTGHLKIRIFLRTRHWIDQKLLSGVKHYTAFPVDCSLVKKSFCPCLPQHTWDTPRACPSWSQWEWGILLSTGWGTPHSHRDIWCYVIKLSGQMYRTKRKCWIPTTLTGFNASWLSLVDVREGCSVSYKVNNTGGVTWRYGWIVGSYPSKHHVGLLHSLVRRIQVCLDVSREYCASLS
jgi:hypothetical protein